MLLYNLIIFDVNNVNWFEKATARGNNQEGCCQLMHVTVFPVSTCAKQLLHITCAGKHLQQDNKKYD